jgi:uncharacterized protein YutE (UPF0331/DUF86 family)
VLADRLGIVARLLEQLRNLPLTDLVEFQADPRNLAAAESCLRRSLEALLDVGRHILAKGYGTGASEYKEIALGLQRHGVLDSAEADLLRVLAGYRNRLVHFYHQVAEDELYEICAQRLGDLEQVERAYLAWAAANPAKLDEAL